LDLRLNPSHSALSRAIKLVNLIVAAVLAVALALVYWFAWRPLPQRSGAVDAPVAAAVSIDFDALGEPHIRAASIEDALFAQGYATAQDRLFQMDGLRRTAAGDLAEVLGAAYLESDREARRMRIRRIAEASYATLPAEDRAAMAAYTRGVNHFIATHRGNLPLEFSVIGYQPRPWSVVDCLIVSLHMVRTLTTTWRDEITKRDMLAGGDRAKVDFLFPAGTGAGPQPGSNAWAVSGSRTASGKPLLSNDMHLEYSLPGIWYMAHLQAPGLDVAGVALPGVPGIMVGHNQRIAWGITNLQFDVQDLYVEKFDERTGRYLYRGQVEQARAEREIIRVKGQAPVEQLVWITRHGPIYLSEDETRMALRWVAAEPGLLQFPILQIDRAANWSEFTTALARYPGPGSNFVYADVDGNIGFHAAGKLPKRRGCKGDTPTGGSTGECEWEGFIPFEELPSALNPASGIIVSANQDAFPAGYPYPVNGNFAPPGRARQIRDRLSARSGWRAGEMLSVQADVYSGINALLARELVAAYERRKAHNPSLDAAVALLRKWNGQMEKDKAAPLLVSLAYRYVRTAAAESASPTAGARYEYSMASSALEKLLTARPAGWFDDYDEMLLRALSDAAEEARRLQGPDAERWQYGRSLRVGINNPVLHKLPVVGGYFDIAPVPMSGAASTVKQTTRSLAPSMRMTADLADWDNSLLNIQTGQAGQALSSHYKDQWKAWYEATSFPMQFHKVRPKSALTLRPAR
jgi:penicillin G amidase